MTAWSRHVPNLILGGLVLLMLYRHAPMALEQWQMEGRQIPYFSVVRLDGTQFSSRGGSEPHVIVFWATWCGPCGVELGRIQELLDSGTLRPDQVTAISSHEEESVVREAVAERGYTFGVGLDPDGLAAGKMSVSVTPTIIFRNPDQRLAWVSSGVSPTLGLRVKKFLGK